MFAFGAIVLTRFPFTDLSGGKRRPAADARLHVVIDILDADALPMAAIAQAGRGLEWLSDEPDLSSDADLVDRAG